MTYMVQKYSWMHLPNWISCRRPGKRHRKYPPQSFSKVWTLVHTQIAHFRVVVGYWLLFNSAKVCLWEIIRLRFNFSQLLSRQRPPFPPACARWRFCSFGCSSSTIVAMWFDFLPCSLWIFMLSVEFSCLSLLYLLLLNFANKT